MTRTTRLPSPNRGSLRHSMKDGVASAVTTGVTDHYLNAYALLLQASTAQIGWLASLPSLIGSLAQLLAAWLAGRGVRRVPLIVGGALAQVAALLPLLALPFVAAEWAVVILIGCVVFYRVAGNLIQPLWQALMGDLVPERRRGRFFARRNRIATLIAFSALAGGGLLLHLSGQWGYAWAGFVLLFAIAAIARAVSAWHLSRMADPTADPATDTSQHPALPVEHGFRPRRTFLRFALFTASVQGAVAVGGPFLGVHLLRDLNYSYAGYMAVLAASVLVQFATLNAWGRISDRFGNRVVLMTSAWMIPVIPALWMVYDALWWMCAVQLLSGLAWGGFSLSSGNYLYDLRGDRPRTTLFAVSALITAAAVFLGALAGGYLADRLPTELSVAGWTLTWSHPLLGLFALSALLRLLVVASLIRGVAELRATTTNGGLREVIYRLARFNSITGVAFDLVATTRRGEAGRNGRRPLS